MRPRHDRRSDKIKEAISSQMRNVFHHRGRQRQRFQRQPILIAGKIDSLDAECTDGFVGQMKAQEWVEPALLLFTVALLTFGTEERRQFCTVLPGQNFFQCAGKTIREFCFQCPCKALSILRGCIYRDDRTFGYRAVTLRRQSGDTGPNRRNFQIGHPLGRNTSD